MTNLDFIEITWTSLEIWAFIEIDSDSYDRSEDGFYVGYSTDLSIVSWV